MPTIENTIPVLPVADFPRSRDFYLQKLGFQLDWQSSTQTIGSVSRDGHPVMLSQLLPQPGGAWAWIGVESHALFDEWRRQGVTVLQEPRNFAWAYEMKFADLDGNVLWLGTECRSDLPVE